MLRDLIVILARMQPKWAGRRSHLETMHRSEGARVPEGEPDEPPPEWSVDPRALLATGRQRVRRRRLALLAIVIAGAVIFSGIARMFG